MKTVWCSIIAIIATTLLAGIAAAQIQSWDKINNTTGRFKILSQYGNAAVLDQETGLVWERSPSTALNPWAPRSAGSTAHIACTVKVVGGRLGWRLPTIQELASLLEPTQFRPPLPVGHPFILSAAQQVGQFWSATTASTDPASGDSAWFVDFNLLDPSSFVLYGSGDKTTARYAWCVRAGQGVDPQ